ncbi:hypothetical protein FACS1894201_10580 [Bacteroidia bacterium]|nr:hypothetical protein FACS1894201_10580 [Bacteroidia bacterium]
MKTNYSKTCTLPQDLIPLLKSRGLSITDEQKVVSYLTNIGYYRLSAYLHPLLKTPKEDHLYKDDATFDMALDMYRFDRKLRILLFNEIEKIEVAIRSKMTYVMSLSYNAFWMEDTSLFSDCPIPYLRRGYTALYLSAISVLITNVFGTENCVSSRFFPVVHNMYGLLMEMYRTTVSTISFR